MESCNGYLLSLDQSVLVLAHVSISVPSVEVARSFYDAAMAVLTALQGFGVRCKDLEDFYSYIAEARR